jgi:hypothetical protein
MGAIWERHGMCELAFNIPIKWTALANYKACPSESGTEVGKLLFPAVGTLRFLQ